MSFDPHTIAAMRDELTKLATEGHGPPPPHHYEEMSMPKWKQMAKDLPAAVLGTAVGYGVGRTTSEYLMPHVLSSPQARENASKFLPAAAAATGGLGTYLLTVQRGMMKKRRDEAERKAQTKAAGAPVPAAANATRKDPWRTDTRYPNYK